MSGYYRYPSLSRDQVAFVCEDSLCIAPREGGMARRLSTGFDSIRGTAFSPDGQHVAFTSNSEGAFEVYVCPVEGGLPRRLTHEGESCGLIGFRPDGKLLYRSSREGPFFSDTYVYEIGLDGTGRQRVPVGRAVHVSFDTDDDTVALGLNNTDSARWKRYRGGTAGDMWIGKVSTQEFRRLLSVDGNPVLPTFAGGRVWFISDADDFGNLWSCTRDGEDLTQHTHHRDYYLRHLQAHGDDLVYQKGAEIFRFDTKSLKETKIEVEMRPSGRQLQRRFVDPDPHLQTTALSHDGKQIACTVRGKLLTMKPWGGPVRWLGERSGVRYRLPAWMKGDEEVVVVSDQGGEEAPEIFHVATGERVTRFDGLEVGRIKAVAPNPAHPSFALTDVAGRLLHIDREGTSTVIAESKTGAIREVAWSPDGRWVSYVAPINWLISGGIVHLHDTQTGQTVPLSTEELPAFSPAFDPRGEFLYVLSERTFNPVLNPVEFGASCPNAGRVYAFVLQKENVSPFDSRWLDAVEEEEEEKEKEEKEEKSGKDEKKSSATADESKSDGEGAKGTPESEGEDEDDDDTPDPVEIDLDGLAQRMVEFPDIGPGNYRSLMAAEHKVIFLSHPMTGLLDEDFLDELDEEHHPSLAAFDMKTSKQTTLMVGVKDFDVEGEKTLIHTMKGLYLLATGEEPPKEPSQPGHNRHTGAIDLDRLRIEVIPAEEWRQMFTEAWRLQRDHFWTETMAGIDWEEVRTRYLPLLDHVATRSELSDLIWELQGELGTSHAYEFGGDYPHGPHYDVGHLGAELSWDGKGYRIDRMLEGDPWLQESRSPLLAPGVNVSVRDRVIAVGGRPLTETVRPETLLVHEADVEVELLIEPHDGAEQRRVVVHTLGSERALRYRDWVLRNRAYVHDRSSGRLGYLHIPDMSGEGLSEFYRAFRTQSKRPGLVVDARDNGGGFVSELIIEHLRRKVIGYDRPRYGRPGTYPNDAVRGPIVAVCDQFAGSDGDIFCHAFKSYGIGQVVGKRTWGGVIGIDINEILADGTIVTQPEFSGYFDSVGWGVENHGVDPDVEVEQDPASMVAGKDRQLDAAIDLALELLEKQPVKEPKWPAIPSRGVVRDRG